MFWPFNWLLCPNLQGIIPFPILSTCPAHLSLLHLIMLTTLGVQCNYEVPIVLHYPFLSLLGPSYLPHDPLPKYLKLLSI